MSELFFAASRIRTGIKGLDELLHGGLPSHGIHLITGVPGSGKTVIANQIAFSLALAGKRVLYITLLAESHAHLLSYIRKFTYFEERLIPKWLSYINAFPILEKDGIAGFFAMLQEQLLKSKPSFLIMDGFTVTDEIAESTVTFKKFVHQLNALGAFLDCTTLLLSSHAENYSRPEHTMIDGLIVLHLVSQGVRSWREIEIRKMRGTSHAMGRHQMQIAKPGITVIPRLEAIPPVEGLPGRKRREKFFSGISGFDHLVKGGIHSTSVTLIRGERGSGKTILGLAFLGKGLLDGESVLYVGFRERPPVITKLIRQRHRSLSHAGRADRLHMLWNLPTEFSADRIAGDLIHLVRTHRIRRVFIDGIDVLIRDMDRDRESAYIIALLDGLSQLQATTIVSETSQLIDGRPRESACGFAVDVNILLEQQHISGQQRNVISVISSSGSPTTPGRFALTITQRSIEISEVPSDSESIIPGPVHVRRNMTSKATRT